ncbi:MAG TPA: CehA/McbA family metallohydrolase [Propylenella sp.]
MSLDAFQRSGRFFRGNLHTHSNISDGALAPEAVCAHYREAGYDFIALTDHFIKRYGYPVADTKRFRTNRFTTIPGAELHAPANSQGEVWHILSVGLPEDFAPTGEEETGVDLARRAADAGAFVAIAHPQWSSLTVEDGRALPMAHAVEIYNHGCALECARGDGAVLLDTLLNEGRSLTAIATDDAHFRYDDACGGWVMVKADENEPGALLAALKDGHFYASQGPMIHAAEISGDALHVECTPAVNIAVVGRGSRAVHIRRQQATRAEIPLERFAGDWFRLVVTDAGGRSAWSNPVRLPPAGG